MARPSPPTATSMTPHEARMWLRGKRSCRDEFLAVYAGNPDPEKQLELAILIAQYDAVMMQQALTILRAYHEGISI